MKVFMNGCVSVGILMVICSCMSGPTYKMKSLSDQIVRMQGMDYSVMDVEGLEVQVAFERSTFRRFVFDVQVTNLSRTLASISSQNFYYSVITSMDETGMDMDYTLSSGAAFKEKTPVERASLKYTTLSPNQIANGKLVFNFYQGRMNPKRVRLYFEYDGSIQYTDFELKELVAGAR